MKLADLVEYVSYSQVVGNLQTPVSGITANSKQVTLQGAFVAIKGSQTDWHAYIEAAIQQGASVIVCQKLPQNLHPDVTYLEVTDTNDALGNMAAAFYDYPSEKMIMVGVTGTNGKTTVATLLYQLFRKLGHKVGLLSTVCNYIDDQPIASTHTTPDAVSLQALLAQMAAAGCRYAFMEVSSHAIDQKRIAGICFDGGIFTNLTRDHLDYHKSVQAYLQAKKKNFLTNFHPMPLPSPTWTTKMVKSWYKTPKPTSIAIRPTPWPILGGKYWKKAWKVCCYKSIQKRYLPRW